MFQQLIAWIQALFARLSTWFSGASAKAEVKAEKLDEKVDAKVDEFKDRFDDKVDGAKDRVQDSVADRIRDYGRDDEPKRVVQVEEVAEIKANVVEAERAAEVRPVTPEVTPEPFVFPDANVVDAPVVHYVDPKPVVVEETPVQVVEAERLAQVSKPKRKRSPRSK